MSFLVLNYHKRLLTFSSFQRAKKVCRLKLLMDFVVKMLLIAHPRSCMWHAYNDSLLAMASVKKASHRQVWQVAMQPLPWQSSDVYRWRGSVLAASAVVELCPHYISRGVRRLSVNAWLTMPRFNSFAPPIASVSSSSSSSSGIRQMMSSNDTTSAALFLLLMISPMCSDFGGFCGRSVCGVSDYDAGGERWQRSTIWSLLHCALSWDNAVASSAADRCTARTRPNRRYFCPSGRDRYVNWS